MIRRWTGYLLTSLLALGTAFAQAERPEAPQFADPVVQGVQEHLNRMCEGHDRRLAAIRTPAQLKA